MQYAYVWWKVERIFHHKWIKGKNLCVKKIIPTSFSTDDVLRLPFMEAMTLVFVPSNYADSLSSQVVVVVVESLYTNLKLYTS